MTPTPKKRLLAGAALLILAAAFGARGRQAGDEGLFRVGLPWKDWALDLRLSDFNVPAAKPARGNDLFLALARAMGAGPAEYFIDDGRGYHLRAIRRQQEGRRPRTTLDIHLKPVTPVVGATDFRAEELKRLAQSADRGASSRIIVRRGSVKTWEYKGVPAARYTTAVEHEAMLNQGGTDTHVSATAHHLAAFYVKDGTGITVTLSAASLKEEEERLFHSLLDSVRLADVSAPSSSFDHYHKGRLLFLQKDYRQAAASFARALTLERLQRQLETGPWRDLVAKLVDAYAATGENARAKEVLDYGLAQEPESPLFNMGLARYHAAAGDADAALAALGKAFASLKKENPRAPLPKMEYDSAFAHHMKDKKFARAVKELGK